MLSCFLQDILGGSQLRCSKRALDISIAFGARFEFRKCLSIKISALALPPEQNVRNTDCGSWTSECMHIIAYSVLADLYTLNYLGSGMGAPQGSGGQRSEMVG